MQGILHFFFHFTCSMYKNHAAWRSIVRVKIVFQAVPSPEATAIRQLTIIGYPVNVGRDR